MSVACPLQCDYCYQEPQRVAGNIDAKYDLGKIIEQIQLSNAPSISFFGGEILMMPDDDLEILFRYAFETVGGSGIQTSGAIMNDNHIEMFVKYNVQIGFSIDGPFELNNLRQPRNKKKNVEEMTANTMEYMGKARARGISCGVIITLHRENSTPERMPRLKNFILWLRDIGITGGNIHTLEIESTMSNQDYVLTSEENIWAYMELANFFKENPGMHWNPFDEIRDMLVGKDEKNLCYWHRCDPLNTQAVHGIEGNGAISNCGRANKEGIDWVKAPDNKFSRYIGFYYTPQELGGCQGCRFWMMCGGSCPGEAMDGDPRNKTMHCATQKAILSHYEQELVAEGIEPVTLSDKLEMLEYITIQALEAGTNPYLNETLSRLEEIKLDVVQLEVVEEEDEDEVITI